MKKIIFLSALVLAAVISTLVYSQSSPETNTRIRDRTSATTQANVSTMGATQPATNTGLNTASGTYYYNGAAWARWPGVAAGVGIQTIPDASTASPLVSGMCYKYDLLNNNWRADTVWTVDDVQIGTAGKHEVVADINMFLNNTTGVYNRFSGEAIDAAIAATAPVAPFVGAYNLYWTGAAVSRWSGEAWDTSMDTTNAPATLSLGTFYENVSTKGYRLNGEPLDLVLTATDPVAPYVGAVGVYYDADNSRMARANGELWSTDMDATHNQPNVNAFGVFYNDSTSKSSAWHGEAWDTSIDFTPGAPAVLSANTFYDTGTTKGYRWQGEALDDVGTAVSPTLPWVGAYGLYRDISNNVAARWTGENYDDNIAMGGAPGVIGLTAFYNGANNQRWQGSVLSSETTANTTYAPHTKDYMHCYDATSGSWRWVNVLDTQADGQASTLNGMVTSSINYAYNGSTFDMMRVGASNELQTTDVATRPGEDAANDWRKTKKEQIGTYSPAATTGTVVPNTSTLTIVLAAVEVLDLPNWCIYLKNTDGGGGAFNDAEVSTSPNNSDWVALSWTDCDLLADGALCVYCASTSAYRYVRARVASASEITVSAWIVGNKG